MTALAPLLEAYFVERLVRQRNASPNTVAAYRDGFRLLLAFAKRETGKAPSHLQLEDLDAALIGAFLSHLDTERHVVARTRNARLAALRSFYSFAALRHPEHAELIARVLAIPARRVARPLVSHLTTAEIEALLAAPDLATRTGRRDRALLLIALRTGLRVSELVSLRRGDVLFGPGAHLNCTGKGRKRRSTPLSSDSAKVLSSWMDECGGSAEVPIFPGPRGAPLTRDAVNRIVARHATRAAASCPSLAAKHVSPHILRHSCVISPPCIHQRDMGLVA